MSSRSPIKGRDSMDIIQEKDKKFLSKFKKYRDSTERQRIDQVYKTTNCDGKFKKGFDNVTLLKNVN